MIRIRRTRAGFLDPLFIFLNVGSMFPNARVWKIRKNGNQHMHKSDDISVLFQQCSKKSTSKNCNSLNNGQGLVALELGEKLNGWSDLLVGAKPKIEKKKELHQAVSRIKHAVLPNHCWRIFGWQFRCALKLSSQCTQDQVVARVRRCDLAVFFLGLISLVQQFLEECYICKNYYKGGN